MPEAIIQFFGQPAKVACDGKCHKAWGINTRPKLQLSPTDEDDFVWMSDGELGTAPSDPGTYEGGDAKPSSSALFPNKWCVRECERHSMSHPGEVNLPLEVRNFSWRVSNRDRRETKEIG